MGRGLVRVEERKEEKGMKKGIKMCYVHTTTPHKKYKHYVLKECTDKKVKNKTYNGKKLKKKN